MQREPIFNVPSVVLALVGALVAIHAWREYRVPDELDAWILANFAFIPGRFTLFLDPGGVADVFSTFTGPDGADQEAAARFFLGDGSLPWWSALTYAGLHADWTHCGVNSLWLVAFGSPVARRIGPLRFLALFAVTAIAGAATHWMFHRYDLAPVIGASAAVSGAMAAACRFMFQPDAGGFLEGRSSALPPLSAIFRDRRALSFLAVWFGLNIVTGLASEPLGITAGPVAWEAHAGGFLAGLLLFSLFDRPPPALGRDAIEAGSGPNPAV